MASSKNIGRQTIQRKKRFAQDVCKKDQELETAMRTINARKIKMANHTSHHRKPKKNHKWRNAIFSTNIKKIDELRLKFASKEICKHFESTPKIFDFDLSVY